MTTTLQQQLLDAALPIIAFEGWTMHALEQAAASINLPAIDAQRAFPNGITEALDVWNTLANDRMQQTLEHDYHLETMKIRERIATAVMVRLRPYTEHREAIRRAVAHYALPWNIAHGTRALYATVDRMWRCAGDQSTDFNFYTKRALLAKVYSTTLTYWLNDESENQEDTEAFLARRIESVMQIQKWKGRLSGWFSPSKAA